MGNKQSDESTAVEDYATDQYAMTEKSVRPSVDMASHGVNLFTPPAVTFDELPFGK